MPLERTENGTIRSTSIDDKNKFFNFEGEDYYVIYDKEQLMSFIKTCNDSGFGSLNLNNKPYNINNMVTTHITDMSELFSNMKKFNFPIDKWDTSNVKDMSYMFNEAKVFNQPLNNWNTSNVTDMTDMFNEAKNFNQPLNNWNTSNVISMWNMFIGAEAFNQPLDNWDTSNVENMQGMFCFAKAFNQPLDNWNTSKVTNMSSMFEFATSFNQPLDTWDTSKVKNMRSMFNRTSGFNQSLDNWDTSNVENMKSMFESARSFNQPLNNWDTSKVKDMSDMFKFTRSFNQPLNNWNTSNVENMQGMFGGAEAFNQPLNSWNTSNVENMSAMFNWAKKFNQPLDNWNTSKVKNMSRMFEFASSFNQSLNTWNTSNVVDMGDMFDRASSFNIENAKNFYINTDTIEKNVKERNIEFFNELLDNPNFNMYRSMNNGYDISLLHLASGLGYTELVKLLIDKGFDVNYALQNHNRHAEQPAIFSAIEELRYDVIKLLLENGANPDIKVDGVTPISEIRNMSDEIIRLTIRNNELDYDPATIKNEIYELLVQYSQKERERRVNLIQDILRADDIVDINETYNININKTITTYDAIEMEDVSYNIKEYIDADPHNIVIKGSGNNYFFSNRNTIYDLFESAINYPCREPDTLRQENIVRIPVYDFKKIGLMFGYKAIIKQLLEDDSHQLFYLVDTDVSYPSFVSYDVLKMEGSMVSASHCQAGLDSRISVLVRANAIQTGGKKKTRKSKKTRKNKKQIKKIKTKTNKKTKQKKTRKNKKHIKKTKQKKTRNNKR